MKTNKYYIFSLIFAALSVFCGNVWGYTITFKTASNDNPSSYGTSTKCSDVVSAGSSYLSTGNLTTATNVYGPGTNGLKLGKAKSSPAGTIKMGLSTGGQVHANKIIVNAVQYNSNSATVAANGATAQTVTNSSGSSPYTFTINGNITYIQLNSSKYVWVRSVEVIPGFKVTYNGNGKTGGSVPTDNTYYDENDANVTIKSNSGNLEKTGYNFVGWNTKADGTGTDISASGSAKITITKDTVLYAKWESAAACTATPTVGVASLNGSFSLTGIGVQCASASAGDNCELLYWGFVYGTSNTGGHPNIDDNSVYAYENYSDNYTNTLIPIGGAENFTTGQTIYYRGFAMNENETEGEEYGYSSAIQSFTPQGVLFYKEKALDNELAYKIVNKGTKVTAPSDPTMTGYTFAGWKNADGDAAFNCATTDIDDDYILYADWTINSHNLTWSTDGNTLEGDYTGKSGKVNFGTTIVAPNTPTKTGYTFKAWSPTVAGTMPDNDVTYTATWTANKYNIMYKDKDNADFSGTHATSYPTQHTYGTATTLSTATKTGYTFGGWYTSSDCSTGLVTSLGETDYTANITLYAKWTIKSCTVEFDKQEGSGGSDDATATYGEALPDITAPTRLHYIFQGYYDAATEGTKYYGADGKGVKNWDKDVTANTTLYAHWTEHTYTNYRTLCCTSWADPTVSYSSSSINVAGTATVTITGTTHGTVSYASSNESVLTVASNGTVTGAGAGTAHVIISWAEADGYCEKTMNSEDITVQGNVTVVFHANNDTEETMDNQSIPVNEATALSANEFTAPSTCQYFYGWATSQALADVGTRAYEDEESVTITEGMNLYAIWKTYRYTIATPTKVGAATATLDVAEVDCDGEVTVTSTADASHKGDPTIEITPIDAGTVNGNKIQNIVKNITAVTVTYAAKEVYTVTWKVGGTALEGDDLDGVTVSVTEGNGLETLPTNPSGTTLSGADTFMGWSTSELSGLGNSAPSDLFTASGDEPTIDGNVTYHAVFATQTATASDSWDLCSAVNDVTAGDYVITWNNEKYLPSETAAGQSPSIGTGITVNNGKLTNTVTSAMQWNFAGNNTDRWTVSHKVDNTTTHYLGSKDAAQGIYVTAGNTSSDVTTYLWTVSVDNTYGMLLHSAGSTRYLAVFTPTSGTPSWRYYTAGSDYKGTMRLYRHNVTEAEYANYITKVVALSSIAISAEAGKTIKTVYKKGETLDLTNMVVTATYADASSRAVTGYTVDLDGALSTDDTKFVVTYEENGVSKTAEQAINVYELSGIAITAGPTTTTYKSGATLSTTGMVVTATWGDNKISEAVTGYTVDLSANLVTTDTEFEVSYTSAGVEKTATKEIHVYDLSGISITAPTKTTYTAGDVFDPAGMEVTATWGGEALDKIVETVDGYTYSEEPLVNDADDPANVNVTISYTSNGVTKTATQEVTVNPKAKKIMTWHVANEDPFTTRIYINAQDKYILALPDDPDPVAAGFTSDYVFKGWTTATSVNKDGSDITKATAGTEMSNDEDFYAVFAQKNGEDSPAGYRIVDAAPAASETVIIARKVNSTYYAMTNSATPGYDALTISNGVISGTTTSYQWSVATATSGVYLKNSSNYLHMNSDALKVASGTDNGDIVFSSNGDGTYKAARSKSNTLDRWIVTDGGNGFDCSATEANALALYIFKYAAATVATYSNYRLVPSTVAVPTGLEAGTYYCTSKSITLSQAAGKPIYYTLDGSTPDNTKTLYSSAIVLNTSKTIKAVAYDSETEDYSGVASAVYTIVTSIAAPTMPATQTFYDESMEAEISHGLTSEGAVIHYSYDDASYSNYSDALTIDETKTVYAYATIGELTSPKASATYTKGVTYTYKKVTSDAGLAVGMKFIIVSGTNGAGAMTSDYLSVVTVPSPNAQSEIAITSQAVKEFTLGGRSGAYQLVSNEGTLGSDAAKSLSYTAGTKTWTISYSGEQVTIENTTTSNGSLQFNSTRFNTYTSGQSAIDIYALPFTAHTLTIKNYDGSDKLTAKVVEGGSFVLTSADAPSGYPTTYKFLDKWTDGTNTYEVNEAVPVGSADVTLQPCWKVTPTANTDINDLPTSVTEIVVTDGKTLEISAGRSLDNLTVEAGGQVSGGSTLTVNNLTINSEAGKSGQLINENVSVNGAIYLEIKLRDGAMDPEASRKWYCISAPFDVAALEWGNGTPMVFNVDYQLFKYDGDKRARTGNGWQRVGGTMEKNSAYFIGFNDENENNQNIIRLKAANKAIPTTTELALATHTQGDNDADKNWNGLGNPRLHYVNLNKTVSVFESSLQGFNPYPWSEHALDGANGFVVGTAFFVKDQNESAMTFANTHYGEYRAPRREGATNYTYCVEIAKENASRYDNRLYVMASETASTSFEEGKDLPTLNGETSNYGALIWTKNYGMRLAVEEAPMVNSKATYDLGIFAPTAGTYSISVAAPKENADLYLTYEGSIIWNLSEGAYTLDLNKGITNGYGLILRANAPSAATGIDEAESGKQKAESVQKIILDEKVFILRGGKMYDVTGKAVK